MIVKGVQKRIVDNVIKNFDLLTTSAFKIKKGLSCGNKYGINKRAQDHSKVKFSQFPEDIETHPPDIHTCFWHKWVTGAVRTAPRDCCPFLLQHRRGVTDGSCVGQFRDAASAGLQRPESAAEWSKLAAGPASQHGPGAMDPGLRQWAQPGEMQGNSSGLNPMRVPHMARSTIAGDYGEIQTFKRLL